LISIAVQHFVRFWHKADMAAAPNDLHDDLDEWGE